MSVTPSDPLTPGDVYEGDSRSLMSQLEPESIALSVWSPPYHVGKGYEKDQTFGQWVDLLGSVVAQYETALRPGGFCVINIADILCFPDQQMPRIQAEALSDRRLKITREDVLRAMEDLGTTNRNLLAKHLGVSEQTVDRRLKGNNIRGGKYSTQTRVKVVGGLIEDLALQAGLYMYDRRIWMKDPAWANSRWHTTSLRAIDEFEYLYFLWKPGVTKVNRSRLTRDEWRDWGSRGVWRFPSVRSNDEHEAMFPMELPRRVIRLLTDPSDVVLDPFAGSGTTLKAAIELDRQPIGFELDPTYCRLARRALRESVDLRRQGEFRL
jgi:DNA modification methylase